MSTSVGNDTKPINKWIVGGGVGLLAAAAVIGLFVITGESTDTSRQDPAATGTVDSNPPPTDNPTTVATTIADSADVAPVTSPGTTPAPAASDAPPPTTTSAPPPLTTDLPVALTTAGPFGVSVGVPESNESSIVTEPMAFATMARDGRIFMQRSTTADEPIGDTTLLVWSPATGELIPLDPPLAASGKPDDTVMLHDVATVDSVVTLLYETRPATCPSPDECIGAILTWSPDTGESTEIVTETIWEGGWFGLQLAENGLIVGSQFESVSSSIFLASIGSATRPTPAELGLANFYDDCNVCPFAYTIDPAGRFIGWLDSGDGVDQQNVDRDSVPQHQVAIVDISDAGGFDRRRLLVDVAGVVGRLEIADIVFSDDGFVGGRAVFSEETFPVDDPQPSPIEISLVSGEIGLIDARSASLDKLDR